MFTFLQGVASFASAEDAAKETEKLRKHRHAGEQLAQADATTAGLPPPNPGALLQRLGVRGRFKGCGSR